MWLGERITDKGIGNGISMLIMIGIVSRLPLALVSEVTDKFPGKAIFFIIELFVLFGIVVAVIALTQATRRIPIQYAKQVIGNKLYGGKRDFIPLKLNSAGVMPIIFAQALMFFPALDRRNLERQRCWSVYRINIFRSIFLAIQFVVCCR